MPTIGRGFSLLHDLLLGPIGIGASIYLRINLRWQQSGSGKDYGATPLFRRCQRAKRHSGHCQQCRAAEGRHHGNHHWDLGRLLRGERRLRPTAGRSKHNMGGKTAAESGDLELPAGAVPVFRHGRRRLLSPSRFSNRGKLAQRTTQLSSELTSRRPLFRASNFLRF